MNNASNPTKGIVLYKCGNTKFGRMKRFQVRKSPQQIMVMPMKAIKKFQKDGNIQPIKHDFALRIIYEQHVANPTIRILRKNNVQIFIKNWLVRFIWQEMRILHVKFLIKHSGTIKEDLCFMPNLIQIIVYIMTLGWEPNIDMELCNTSLQKFF